MLTEEDKIYLAGLIDGEGSIELMKPNRHYVARVRIVMLYNDVLLELYNKIGIGRLRVIGQNGKKFLHWEADCKQATKLLELVLPYLRLKKKEAELILLFQKHKNKHRSRPLTEEEKQWREDIKKQFDNLKNQRLQNL